MANSDPTGHGTPVPVDQIRFLRTVFEMARGGIQDELAKYPDQLKEPACLRREEAVYGRLLAALDKRVIVPDRDVRTVLGDLAKIIDGDNEYSRVVERARSAARPARSGRRISRYICWRTLPSRAQSRL